ncbi:hypothetical protein [Paenibacillus sediminis]|uniref:Glucan phosphoethanolaminetransferase (Alkaline phosphatase superfamily) n=1 Tax=Paenibacillus sediminis TaxID=664909 RepID=A0ABS4H313_9BACL|nr:hypothetical protein [Paenibacillus sediminis]MBP1936928.1 glucan phosphoethanolaminetransferase (alkaline phosphatase superfamily) [Paenibacillus sediminis]
MIIFAFISIYLIPILGFLFVVALLRAIKKIVKDKSYTTEVFWSGLLFGLIVWCIAVVAISNEL